jgi:ribosomal protein S18 acetylase RimI-like enzyme
VKAPSLRAACDGNYAAAFAALIPHVGHEFGTTRTVRSVVAVATGLEHAFYNPVIATQTDADPEDVVEAVHWIRSLGLAASVQLRDDLRARFESVLGDLGLEADPWVTPGMALYPIPRSPTRRDGLRIERVGVDTFEDWHEGIAYGPRFKRVFGATLLDDPAFRFVVGYLDDHPVAGAAAILADGVAGIYAVGTVESARGRGFGQAVSWGALEAGVEAGCDVAVLQSTEMAVSVYARMGFVEVCRYVEYLPSEE